MFVLNSRVKIGIYHFGGVHEIEVRRSINNLNDTATIVLPSTPAKVRSKKEPSKIEIIKLKDKAKLGDEVIIELGYNGDYKQEFKGFVASIKEDESKLIIACEAGVWLLRKKKVNKYWSKTTLKSLLDEVLKDTGIKYVLAADMPLTNIHSKDGNAARLLFNLKEKVFEGLLTMFFIKPDTIWVGLRYTKYGKEVKYQIGRNIISFDQREVAREDTKINVMYRKLDGSKTTVTTRNLGVKEKKIVFNHVSDLEVLKELAEVAYNKHNNDLSNGTVLTFLQPFVEPGDKATIIPHPKYPFEGSYLVVGVKVTYGISGARREVELGPKVGSLNETVAVNVFETPINIA